jgi:release factor glutamine methyltransferase
VALTAALVGWADVTAIDVSRRAIASTRLNSWHLGLSVRARRVSFMELPVTRPFDLIVSNPPYVPCAVEATPAGRARSSDAGPDGRAVLDQLCAITPGLLSPAGCLLLVQSDVSGVDATLEQLRARDMRATVVANRRTPFGPVMRERAGFLEDAGLIAAGARHENLVVIRAERA